MNSLDGEIALEGEWVKAQKVQHKYFHNIHIVFTKIGIKRMNESKNKCEGNACLKRNVETTYPRIIGNKMSVRM